MAVVFSSSLEFRTIDKFLEHSDSENILHFTQSRVCFIHLPSSQVALLRSIHDEDSFCLTHKCERYWTPRHYLLKRATLQQVTVSNKIGFSVIFLCVSR
jgi:hypothetical protein